MASNWALFFLNLYYLPITSCRGILHWHIQLYCWSLLERSEPCIYYLYKEIEAKRICPKTEKELSDIDPTSYKVVKDNAKTYGYCNGETGEYIWLVRPSAYYMMVFKNHETAVVRVPNQIITVHHWKAIPTYFGDKKLIP